MASRVPAPPKHPSLIAEGEPCSRCNATGLVDTGEYKVRRTCPVCHGARVTVLANV